MELSHDEVLCENSKCTRSSLKIKLRKYNLLDNSKCNECGLGLQWNNKPLVLQIDHINGINNDNRLENLRWLCPNCHSQTSTFAGRRFKKEKIKKGHPKTRPWLRKAVRPSKEELEQLLWTKPTIHISKDYGVSDRAVGKWAEYYGITKPPRGYWRKVQTGKINIFGE